MMPSNDADSDRCTRWSGYTLEAGYSNTPLPESEYLSIRPFDYRISN